MRQEHLAQCIIDLLTGICWYPPIRAAWDPGNDRLRIRFEPDSKDMRFCMGVDGVLIKGLQFLAKVIGARNGYSTSITLVQNYLEAEKEEHVYQSNPKFDSVPVLKIAGSLLASALGEEVRIHQKQTGDKLELRVEAVGDNYEQSIMALEEALAAYGYRNGFVIKISVAKNHTSKKAA